MDKHKIEIELQDAFEHGFWPSEITRYSSSSPLRVIDNPDEPERIIIAHRTQETDGRQHNHQFVYSLEEAEGLLAEYRS